MKQSRMFLILLVLPAAAGYGASSTAVEVKVTAEVKSNIFSYAIENRAERGILSVRIPQHGTYFYTMPEGWTKEVEGEMLHFWTDQLSRSIRPGNTGRFSMRVSSAGAVLGKRPITVELDGGKTVTVADIQVPVREPIGYIGFIAGCILMVLVIHSIATARSRRRTAGPRSCVAAQSDANGS